MGYGYQYICKKCGNEKSLYYGIGFLGHKSYFINDNYKNLVQMAEEDRLFNLDKLKEFIKQKKINLKDNYEYTDYVCRNCNQITTHFKYSLLSDDKHFYPIYRCNFCNSKMRLRRKSDKLKLKCEKCGGESFDYDEYDFINWD